MSELRDRVILEIKKIFDPEIPVNIYDLGLIYKIDIQDTKKVNVEMTLTSPNCPVAEQLPQWVQAAVTDAGYTPVRMQLTFDPPWEMSFMSDDARLIMGM